MALPLAPPLDPMLSKSQPEIPKGDGWIYEPKWDGFRAIVFKDGKDVHIASRDHKPLERYFPELPDALRETLPARCIVDGEVVIAREQGLDFDVLLQRIHPAESRIRKLAAETPASFVAFDILALATKDLTATPIEKRREALEKILGAGGTTADLGPGTQVIITPQTDDFDIASDWFVGFEDLGLDGIVAKRAGSPYTPGDRTMVKVKHLRDADCVVGGYRLSKKGDGVGSLLLGLYSDDGVLHYVGHTSSFKAPERRALLERLRELEGGESFGQGRTPGGPSRWSAGRDTSWVSLDPVLVCEVAYERLQSGRFRHSARFLRWRPDKPPAECTFEQLPL